MIIHFDGVLGDFTCNNMFAENATVKYVIRYGAEAGLKFLLRKYQLAIIRKMTSTHFTKFKEYFSKRGIEFNAVYKDCRSNCKMIPHNYKRIYKDFGNSVQSVVLGCYNTEMNNYQTLGNSCIGEIQSYVSNDKNISMLIPHLKLGAGISTSMELISKSIDVIVKTIENHSGIHTNSSSNPYKADAVLASFIANNLLAIYTDQFQTQISKILAMESELYKRWLEARRRKKMLTEGEEELGKKKQVKNEMISSLMTSKVEAYRLVHLANQYSRIVESVHGGLSQAAIAETKCSESFDWLRNVKEEKSKADGVLLLLTPGNNNSKAVEVIAAEKHSAPYLNLATFFQKKSSVAAGSKK
eukprot:TRINITY_DN9383_c0_g9_i1.p1 TRINITY_DN9383_c0_g9~~TRINITY_DN9383_c0_g9_i1.p1  ORF type:complete len:356 (-),score=49.92 TRINITY_DN9383_c0_g9_i1:167-1234(-)